MGQFGVMLYRDQPVNVLIDRISWLESLGFDLTSGRFELGIGVGIFASDHLSVGEKPWTAKERRRLEYARPTRRIRRR